MLTRQIRSHDPEGRYVTALVEGCDLEGLLHSHRVLLDNASTCVTSPEWVRTHSWRGFTKLVRCGAVGLLPATIPLCPSQTRSPAPVGEVIISVTLPTDEKTQRVFHELSTWEAFAHRAFLDLLDSYLDAPSRGTAPCVPAEHSLDIPCSLLVRILGFALAAVQLAFSIRSNVAGKAPPVQSA